MKKLLILAILLLVLGIAIGPKPSQAFNSATHVYITEKVANKVFPFTFDRTDLYYGSIAPDISSYANPLDWPNGFCETHYGFIKLPYPWWNLVQKAFAQGWQIHNEIWGADFYAHGTCCSFENCVLNSPNSCKYNGYVSNQAAVLNGQIDNLYLAHFAIEVAIDILLVDNYDHYLGQKLLGAALFRSPEDIKLLTKVFVGKGEEIGTDLQTLSSAESTFRNLVMRYALALTLPENLRMAMLGELGVEVAAGMDVTIDSATVQAILQAAIRLCEQTYYSEAIKPAIDGIISKKPELIK